MASAQPQLRIGARKSALARAQADLIATELDRHGISSTFVPISTHGDVDSRELTQIGGAGVFTGAVRQALLDGRIDVGVHSLKDLPTEPVDGLEIVAYPPREDTRDVLVGRRLDDLRPSTQVRIGTGAPRRVVQLNQLAHDRGIDISASPVRGNVNTRIDLVRSGQLDAVVLAAAGLTRLGLLEGDADTVTGLPVQLLPQELMLSAPGQGALAVEIASSLDSEIRAVLTRLDDTVTRAEVLAERRFLAVLGAGCTAPVGARATRESSGNIATDLTLHAVIGKTRGDGEIQHAPVDVGQNRRPLGSGKPDPSRAQQSWGETDQITTLDADEVIRLHGGGSAADPQDLGRRVASHALSFVDIGSFSR